jgi:putative transposase
MVYLQTLRQIIAKRGSENLVYLDESGFEPEVCRRYGWSRRGQQVYGDHAGHRRPRQSLIAARRGQDFLAPMLFSGTATTNLVNHWTRFRLCQELRPNSTIIFDNAAFHNKKDLEAVAHEHGHHILFLPPYSPDFSRIEPDFANLKKRRQYAPPNTPLADIIKCYGNYLI